MNHVTATVDAPVYTDLKDGEVTFEVFLSTSDECSDDVLNAIGAWSDPDAAADIIFRFPLSEIVSYIVDGHDCVDGSGVELEAKPKIDAIRAAMVAEIERIDAIKWRLEPDDAGQTRGEG